jgi:hypothetical protein
MALNLNDEKAIDYSSDVPYFPFDTYGQFDFAIIAAEESGDAGSEKNKSDKEFDVYTVEILASNHSAIRVGEKVIFWFQTGGDGVTQKNRAYKAGELRQFVSAAMGVHPTSAAYKKYDALAGRKELLARDFEAVETGVRLNATKGQERKGNPGTFYTDKAWAPLAA